MRYSLVAAGLLLLAACGGNDGSQAVQPDAGGQAGASRAGSQLIVEDAPFTLKLTDGDGHTVLQTLPADERPAPLPAAWLDLLKTGQPFTEEATYVPIGWVVGKELGLTIPAFIWQGNRLINLGAGFVVSVTGVVATRQEGQATVYELATNAAPLVGNAELRVEATDAGSWRLHLTPPEGLPVAATVLGFASPEDEGLYGLGARKDAFNQRGLLRSVWTEQQNIGTGPFATVTDNDPTGILFDGPSYTFPNGAQAAYYVEAALFGSRGWGAWIEQTELSRLDLAAGRADALRWVVMSPEVTLHLAGSTVPAASRAYTDHYGRAPAPPDWVYEPWFDVINEGEGEAAPNGMGFDGGERVRDDVLDIVRRTQELDIPLGVLGMEGWHRIPEVESFTTGLQAQGYHLAAYWNMFTSQESGEPYQEAVNRNLFIKTPLGTDYPIVTNRQGLSNLIDFTHPDSADYWEGQLRRSLNLGFEGFMHDFGELTTEGMVFANGEPLARNHNLYPVRYHQAARRALDNYVAEHPGFEPFFYVRAGYNGVSATTSSVFPGDESTDFSPASGLPSVIPAMLNLSLTGMYSFSTDVGGYFDFLTPRTDKELFIRWSQLAAFTPIMRLHSSTFNTSVYPWDFDEETIAIFRRYGRAKMQLKGLVNGWSQRAAATGEIGPVRPLFLVDDSAEARDADYQWLLGKDILVAPVIARGATEMSVYLPANGHWERARVDDDGKLVPQGDIHAGGQRITVAVDLADIPVFLRR